MYKLALGLFLVGVYWLCLASGRPVTYPLDASEEEAPDIYFDLVFSALFEASHSDLILIPYFWGTDDLTLAHRDGCTWLRNQSGIWETVDHLPPYQDTLSMSVCRLMQTASGQLFLGASYYVEDGQAARNATHIHAVHDNTIDPQWHQAPLDSTAVTAMAQRLIEDELLLAILEPQAVRWYQWQEAENAFQLGGSETLISGQAVDLQGYPALNSTDYWLLMADEAETLPLREWDGDQFVPFPDTLPGPARGITGCAWGNDQCAWVINIEEDTSKLWCWDHNHTTFELRTLLYGEAPQHTECLRQDEAGVYVWHVTATESMYFRCPITEPFVCERLVEDLPGGMAMAAVATTFALITVNEDDPEQQELRLYVERFGEPPVSPTGTLSILMPFQPRGVRDPIGSVNVTGTLTGTQTLLVPWEDKESLRLPEGSYLLETALFKKNGKPCSARFTSYPDGETLEEDTVFLMLDKETLVYVQYKCPRGDKSAYYALVLLLLIYPIALLKMGYDGNESQQKNWAKDLSLWETLKWSFKQTLPPQPKLPKKTKFTGTRRCRCCQLNSPALNPETRLCNTCQCAHYHHNTMRCTRLAVSMGDPDGSQTSLYYCADHLICRKKGCARHRKQPLVPYCDKHKCRTTVERERQCLPTQYIYANLCFEPRSKDSPYCEFDRQCQGVIYDDTGTIIGRCFRERSTKIKHATPFCDYHRCRVIFPGGYPCTSQAHGHGFCKYHFAVCEQEACDERIPWKDYYCCKHNETGLFPAETPPTKRLCATATPCYFPAGRAGYCEQHTLCLAPDCQNDRLPFSPKDGVIYPYCEADTCQAMHIIETPQGEPIEVRCNQKAQQGGLCGDHAAACFHCGERYSPGSLDWGMYTQCEHQCAALEYDIDGKCRPCTAAVATRKEGDETVYMRCCVAHLNQPPPQSNDRDSSNDDDDDDQDEDEGEEEEETDGSDDEDGDEDADDDDDDEGKNLLSGLPPVGDTELSPL